MKKIEQLPYFQINNTRETNKIARFILKKIKKTIEEKMLFHYLIFARQDKKIEYIKKTSKKYPYFLYFDIEKYYPNINHKILMENVKNLIELNLQVRFPHGVSVGDGISRRMRHYLKYEIRDFLKKSPIKNKGLALGNYLAWVLAGFYLLPLDLKIQRPFLRVQDDYLIFCKKKKEAEKILKEIIEPELERLGLKINIKKMNSGKFHQNPMEFMGFRYYAGIFTISENKRENFKSRILKITHLTSKKPVPAIIKLLNNKILGFGHYYKFALCNQKFEELDAFIRQRLRRYLTRNKDQKQKNSNLFLTNQKLRDLKLRSLVEIKRKYASKKGDIVEKSGKKEVKIGKSREVELLIKSGVYIRKTEHKVILDELKRLTSLMRRTEKRIEKIEKNLEGS